jgi:site-specific DNA-cytosine methylase
MNYLRVLELFSGTGSVGKICKSKGYEVVSLDLKGADINCDILNWDYKKYPIGHFDIIWASPPCDTFSALRRTWIGRKLKCHKGEVCTSELLQKDIDEIGVPILRKTEEIIDYFKPKLWFIENPKTGRMKEYIDKPFYDVDYCKYSDWGYKKPTRIWTNKVGFIPKICTNDCEHIENGKHKVNFGGSKTINDNGKIIKVKSKELREKYKDFENIQPYLAGGGNNRNERYRIPPILVEELIM